MFIKYAVILAAGLGSRLEDLTDDKPKCLVEINKISILERLLNQLDTCSLEQVVIVIGYLGQKIIDRIGYQYKNLKITYIWNHVFYRTNTMFSVWLARQYITRGVLLIEGDTVFGDSFVECIQKPFDGNSYWLVDRFVSNMDGSMSIVDDKNRIIDLRIVRSKLDNYCDNYYKSVGVLSLSPAYGLEFVRWLESDVERLNVQIYYDEVIAKHLREYPLFCRYIKKIVWFEIDTKADLRKAEDIL